jgi:hypothetical protein
LQDIIFKISIITVIRGEQKNLLNQENWKKITEKTEPKPNKKQSQTGKKPSQTKKTEPNQFEPIFVLKNRIETNRFEPVSVFLKKFSLITIFL